MPTKLIVTHPDAMRRKYGEPGWQRVHDAIGALIAADAGRGLHSRLEALPGSEPSATAVKTAIDRLWAAQPADYLLLVGAPDVLPQATLANPLFTSDPDDDPDALVPSDLPYACDAPLGPAPRDFRGPSRVVGRLPGELGASTPDRLLRQLEVATTWSARSVRRPIPLLALSTHTWRASTAISVEAIGDAGGPILTCPIRGPVLTSAELAAPLHLFNCHGLPTDPMWYGERFLGQWPLPPALDPQRLDPAALSGVVLASEACYGGMQWAADAAPPSVTATYLDAGALGAFVASTTTYGPAAGHASADLMVSGFLASVAQGASLGRAALSARQAYVAQAGTLDPTDQKTLAQFDLLGDPSIHPIAAVGPHVDFSAPTAALPPGTHARRARLATEGARLERSSASAPQPGRPALSADRFRALTNMEPTGGQIRTFESDALPCHVAFVRDAPGCSAVVVVQDTPGGAPTITRLERKR